MSSILVRDIHFLSVGVLIEEQRFFVAFSESHCIFACDAFILSMHGLRLFHSRYRGRWIEGENERTDPRAYQSMRPIRIWTIRVAFVFHPNRRIDAWVPNGSK